MNLLLCPDAVPSFLGIFDFSIAPSLLFYSYIPIIVLSLFFALYILFKDKFSLSSKLFFAIATSFLLWVLNILVQWIAAPVTFVHFSAQLTALFEILIFIFSIYFTYVFLKKHDIPFWFKCVLFSILSTILFVLPLKFNTQSFDITLCQGVVGDLWKFMYGFEILSIIGIFIFGVKQFFTLSDKVLRRQALIFTIGVTLFLTIFSLSNIYGEITQVYQFNFYGPIGMVLFLGFISFMIVRYRAFDIKLIGAQALVWALVILIGSQFFYLGQTSDISLIIITAFTLVIAAVLGLILVRGVKKENLLNEQLQSANAGQKNLIHIMNHQIKGHLGINKNIFAELMTDDYGKIPDAAKPLIKKGLDESDIGVQYVTAVLRGASAENGTLPYDMHDMDIKSLISSVVEKQKEFASKKGLSLDFHIDEGNYKIIGDITQLGEAIKNLIDNSINYTPKGNIWIALASKNNAVFFAVRDNGVGIKEEDKPKIFRPGGVSDDSIKINTNSSGYGLAFVKGVIEAHKGKVWFESDGAGKGTTFFVELPVA